MPKYRSSKPKITLSLLVTVLVLVGLVSAILLIRQDQVYKRASAAAEPVALAQTVDGGATSAKTVSTSGTVTAQSGNVYLAGVSMKPYREVVSVTGMGLNWSRLKNQCGARNATGAELWVGTGTPTTDKVVATFANAPENSLITVSSFTNPNPATPIGTVLGVNTKGINGGCSGGTDSDAYSFDFMASPNSMTFGVVADRLREHTPGTGFTEVAEFHQGKDNGDKAGLALIAQSNSTGGTQKVTGKFNSEVDWAVIVVQVNGQSGSATPVPTTQPTTQPGTPVPTVAPTGTPSPTTPPPATPVPTPPPTNNPPPTGAVQGIWTSAAELASKPMTGDAWNAVKSAADALSNTPNPNLDNQDDNTNVQTLAAAIVYARTGQQAYKDKVVKVLQKVEVFVPNPETGRTLAWGRETGAYAMAADLVGYRTTAFERKMRDMAETYICSERGTNLLTMFKERPNNWGAMAFASLTAIYAYLGDTAKLQEVRSYFVQNLTGPKPAETAYDDDMSWHCDPSNPRAINPPNCVKTCGGALVNVGGVVPDDMRRGGSCKANPGYTNYPWGTLEGYVTGARVLERAGMPVWDAAGKAICNAAAAQQEGQWGTNWKAAGDDRWQLPFLDRACGKNWSQGTGTDGKPYGASIWQSGKAGGWGYVIY